MLYILIAFLGLLIGGGIVFLILHSKLKKKELKEKEEAEYWIEIKHQLEDQCNTLNDNVKDLQDKSTNLSANITLLETTSDNLRSNISQLSNEILEKQNSIQEYNVEISHIQQEKNEIQTQYNQTYANIAALQAKREELNKSIDLLFQQQQVAAKEYFAEAKKSVEQSFDDELTAIADQLEQSRDAAREVYLKTLEDTMNDFQKEISEKTEELQRLDYELAEMRSLVATATAARKREEEMSSQKDFYKLQLSEEDISEIRRLREVLPYLRDKEPLNKVIYKVYYEKPYTDLVGRVIGQGRHTGIYKITNIENGMCYIGQSVDIRERWRQHIKRGTGAEPPTRNKLYPAMLASGVENFTFEIIEECNETQLDEKEKYWQTYFGAQEYGYSIR